MFACVSEGKFNNHKIKPQFIYYDHLWIDIKPQQPQTLETTSSVRNNSLKVFNTK